MYYIIWAAADDAGDSQRPREGQRIICQLSTPPSGLVSRLAAGKRNLLCLARRAVAPLGAVWCGFAHLVTCFGLFVVFFIIIILMVTHGTLFPTVSSFIC